MSSVKIVESVTSMKMFEKCLIESSHPQCKAVAYVLEQDIWREEQELQKSGRILELLRKKKELTVVVANCELTDKTLPVFLAADLGIVTERTRIVWDADIEETVKDYLGTQEIEAKDHKEVWDAETMYRYGLANKIVHEEYITKETREYLEVMTDDLSLKQIFSIKECFLEYQKQKDVKRQELIIEEMKQFCILSEEQFKRMVHCDDS